MKSKKIEKALSVIRRPTLTRGQKDLYSLIQEKLEASQMILYAEAESIWLTKVCREIRGGYEPLTKDMVTARVMLWLTSNIGALVLKGYLKVIPMIEVKNLI